MPGGVFEEAFGWISWKEARERISVACRYSIHQHLPSSLLPRKTLDLATGQMPFVIVPDESVYVDQQTLKLQVRMQAKVVRQLIVEREKRLLPGHGILHSLVSA